MKKKRQSFTEFTFGRHPGCSRSCSCREVVAKTGWRQVWWEKTNISSPKMSELPSRVVNGERASNTPAVRTARLGSMHSEQRPRSVNLQLSNAQKEPFSPKYQTGDALSLCCNTPGTSRSSSRSRGMPAGPHFCPLCHFCVTHLEKKKTYPGLGLPQSCRGSRGKGVRWETLCVQQHLESAQKANR